MPRTTPADPRPDVRSGSKLSDGRRHRSAEPGPYDGVVADDRVFAIGAGRDDGRGDAADFFEPADVRTCGVRQIIEPSDAPRGCGPARHRLVNRLASVEHLQVRGKVGEHHVTPAIAGADGDLLHPVQDIELRERQRIEAVDPGGIANGDRIVPATPPRTPRRRAVLLTALAEAVADLVVQLG